MSLRFNNNIYIDEIIGFGDNDVINDTIQVLRKLSEHPAVQGVCLSFVINPLDEHSYGHINMSRILKKELTLFLNPSSFSRSARVRKLIQHNGYKGRSSRSHDLPSKLLQS